MSKKFYVTTPIYYVNSVPHVGHALTMLVCDIEKRFHQLRGQEAYFLTGTDENGLKVLEAANERGMDPMAFVDEISETFRVAADTLNFDYDVFFRTTSDQHKRAAQALFSLLQEKGFIYLDTYEGWYDVSAETFVRESDLVDGKSPDGNEVRRVSEENYFFKLSAFGDRLLEHADANPEFWLPEGRRSEVVSFIHQGLRDVCITRSNPGWGIEVPGDPTKVIYVWFDALINYLAATGWPDAGWENLWPADVHWMAKEIYTRFHATLWPAMLMAADLPLPKTVVAHGWFTFNDSKMSKSKGNVLAPKDLIEEFVGAGVSPELSVDVARFALCRLLPFDNDTNFTLDEVAKHYNADLANDVGNALNRSINMCQKFVDGAVTEGAKPVDEMVEAVQTAKANYAIAAEHHRFHEALDHAIGVVRFMNKFIADRKPWQMHKEGDTELPMVLNSLLYGLRALEGMLRPIMPATADSILDQLGYAPDQKTHHWDEIGDPSTMNFGQKVKDPQPLFPRLQPKPAQEPKMETPTEPKAAPATAAPATKEIEFADFMKLDLRVGRVLEAENVPNSEKLIKLDLIVGEEKRQVLAGIQKSYKAADLVGRQVIVLMNLKPRKLAGLESQGMVLAADGPDGTAILLTPEMEAPEGTSVH